MQYITGESVANFLTSYGLPCSCQGIKIAPQLVRYSLNLQDLSQLQKARRFCENLGAWAGTCATFTTSDCSHFAIDLARNERRTVFLNEFADTLSKKQFAVALGIDTAGELITPTLDDLTHLLVAGTTGSGKSVALTDIILSLACYNTPNDLGLVLIDPKRTEFAQFDGLPHLLTPIVTETDKAEMVLQALIQKMEIRYKKMATLGIKKANETFKKIVVVIDELADLVLQNEHIKDLLVRLLQKSRACGFYFVVATQSPRASILSGLLLANLPSRLILTCASTRESILALGNGGAEKLQGKGDAFLKLPANTTSKRLQVPFITDEELKQTIV